MFEGTMYSAIVEAKKEIDFNSLQFPIYRKSERDNEWYRFDSVAKLISVRKKECFGVGISHGIHSDVFVILYSFKEECSKEEFEEMFKSVMDMLVVA